MLCPKCEVGMVKVAFDDIEVDRCGNCEGLWFDMLELEHLKEMQHSGAIDVGYPEKGEKFNEIDNIDCPVCHTPMIKMVDKDQPHIHYEGCTVCYGVFFDAGEFQDYKHETVLDFFRDIIARKKKG